MDKLPDFRNLDSTRTPSVDEVNYITHVGPRASSIINVYPIYWVSPKTMDKCVPPSMVVGINPKCLEERIWSLSSERVEMPLIEEVFEVCSKRYENVAMGAFLPKGCGEVGVNGPAILISPERVESEANDLVNSYKLSGAKTFRSLLKAVLAHELGHAYAFKFTGPLDFSAPPFRAFEEAIAQLFAYTNISEEDRIIMALESKAQSAEYRAWYPLTVFADASIFLRWMLSVRSLANKPLSKQLKPSYPFLDFLIVYSMIVCREGIPSYRYLYYLSKLRRFYGFALETLPLIHLLEMVPSKRLACAVIKSLLRDLEDSRIDIKRLIRVEGIALAALGALIEPIP